MYQFDYKCIDVKRQEYRWPFLGVGKLLSNDLTFGFRSSRILEQDPLHLK